MGKERENREFAGVLPKNQFIVERVRKEGYYSMLFNKADFMEAVVWAANVVYDFKDFYRLNKDRIVIPEAESPFRKDDLINAHFLMIVYYKMKENLIMAEELKQGLFNVARFQHVPAEDVEIMKKWDDYVRCSKQKQETGDLSGSSLGSLQGTEIKYERYSGIVAREIAKYQEDLAKL